MNRKGNEFFFAWKEKVGGKWKGKIGKMG